MVSAEPATIYRGGGRRWLTALAAARAEARKAIMKRCDCERGDWGNPPVTCWYHEPERYAAIRDRMARFYLRRLRAAAAMADTATPDAGEQGGEG